ncbi:prepilin-type N-terminal cleavage/methylation domain-containing protein [Stenotrophomonas acidaminiphila]|uniref:prepilin-type N-terminal cleavage/methylation domain-containing protein n=1 Tax=Stenotrophomonas acidaminiphila TaxID=128780 RepID=UPI001D967692|nr:prepilin-type N-terminal cleavage/methylation domain-containing protein [Stenotrophomonas sp.]
MKMQKGFTLIELMIVVAIIAILSAIALPAYNNYRVKSANNACLGEAKAFMNSWVSAVKGGIDTADIPTYTAKACTSGPTLNVADAEAAAPSAYTFAKKAPGTKDVTCAPNTATCELAP